LLKIKKTRIMNTVMAILGVLFTILGVIFLIIIFVITALFILMLLGLKIWKKRISAMSDEEKFDLKKPMNSNVLEIFYRVPIFGHLFKKQFTFMSNGIDYFNDSIPLIIVDWNSQELVKRSTRQFLDSLKRGEPEKSFESYFYTFGKLKEFKGITKISNYDYVAEAIFEKDLAWIQVQLLQDNGRFSINNFKVDCLTNKSLEHNH
jgi:hypothetical protein